jgi:hypothetical protein
VVLIDFPVEWLQRRAGDVNGGLEALERGCYSESRYADPYQPISLTELKVLVIRGIALKLSVEEAER